MIADNLRGTIKTHGFKEKIFLTTFTMNRWDPMEHL